MPTLLITSAAQDAILFVFQEVYDAKPAYQLAVPAFADSIQVRRIAVGYSAESGHAEVVQRVL